MIHLLNTLNALERYVFEFISMNTGLTFNFNQENYHPNMLSINYFQNRLTCKGKTIYIYKSSEKLNNIGTPNYLSDNTYPNTKIPIFYSIYNKSGENVLYNFSDNFPAIWKSNDIENKTYIVVNFDLIKNICYHLTCYEEYKIELTDEHRRFSSYNNTLRQYNINDFPVVDYLIDLLFKLVNILYNKKYSKRRIWPNGKKYAVCLTHDVDHIQLKTLSRFIYRTYRAFKSNNDLKQKYKKLSELFMLFTLKKDIYNNFDEWIKIESKFGFHSSFYFISRNICESLLSMDKRYSIKKRFLKNKIQEISKCGWEIGLHGYCNSYKKLNFEKKLITSVLGKKIIGTRQHYLRIKVPETWMHYEKIGLQYDSSLGFSDRFGFRAGTSYPFLPFDVKNNRKIELLIIPLIIMDTVFLNNNHNNSLNNIIDVFIKFKKIIFEFGGVLTLLWHQEYFNDFEYPHLKQSYEEILKILSEDKDVFIGSGKEIYDVVSDIVFNS